MRWTRSTGRNGGCSVFREENRDSSASTSRCWPSSSSVLSGWSTTSWWGLLIALAVGLSGLIAFGAHTYQRRGGAAAFGALPSRLILWATLVLSLPQIGLSLYALL